MTLTRRQALAAIGGSAILTRALCKGGFYEEQRRRHTP